MAELQLDTLNMEPIQFKKNLLHLLVPLDMN